VGNNEKTVKKRRKRKAYRILIVLLLIGAAAFTLYRLSLKKKLQARIEAVRAAGYPVTGAELNDWYTIPDDVENAADIILDAISYYREPQDSELLPLLGKVELPARTEPLTEEAMNVIDQYLSDNQKTLGLLHEAATIEHSRYPIDFSDFLGIRFDYYPDIRNGVRLLNLEAISYAENDNPELAGRSITSAFGIARTFAKEPISVSQFFRSICQALTISTLERVINRIDFTNDQLAELDHVIADAQAPSAMSRAFTGQRCLYISNLNINDFLEPALFGRNTPVPLAELYIQLYKVSGLADRDKIIYLDLMGEYIKAAQLPIQERQKAFEAIDAKIKAKSNIHILLHTLLSGLSRYIIRDLENFARLRTAQIALAVQRYRLSKGKLPDSLEDLVPSYLKIIPTDPFDGKEMRYKKLDTGYVIYSIGENLSDDGGTEIPPTTKERREAPNWDVTFIVVLGTPYGKR